MKHTVTELIDVVYTYYPRGLQADDPAYESSPEYQRLMAARKKAGREQQPWRILLGELQQVFPRDLVTDHSLHLLAGSHDAGYVAIASFSESQSIGFSVSFLVPYYIVCTWRPHVVPERFPGEPADSRTYKIRGFDFTSEEGRYVEQIARAIEAAWDYELMSPGIGCIVVPDVSTTSRPLGEATLLDCLMSDYL